MTIAPNRRDLLLGVSATVAAACAPTPSLPRPNIVWLVSEDNNPLIGAYGDGMAHTPAIDGLAKAGTLYANAYSTAPVCAPSRFSIVTGVYAQACAPANQMRAKAALPDFMRAVPSYMREAGYYCTNNAKTDYNCDLDPAAIWDESSKEAHWQNRPADKPFFAIFNFETTHESQLFERVEGRVKPQDVRVPAYLPDTPEVRGDIATYYNLMEKMDGQVADHLAQLERAGLTDNTIVFYYSDNGGAFPRSKRYCYDNGLRCPLIVSAPTRWAHLFGGAGARIEAPATLIDLGPTILTLAGAKIPAYMQGRSLTASADSRPAYAFGMRNRMDERYDFVRTATDGRFRYIRNYAPHRPWGMYGAYEWLAKGYQSWDTLNRAGKLSKAQSQFFSGKPYEEFYDVTVDPDQITNLIGSSDHDARITEFRQALDSHMLDIRDNGFIPEGSPLEGYVQSREDSAYPLARIMQLAQTAAQRNPASLAPLREGLNDPNEIIRYWAASGLLMLGAAAAPTHAELKAMQANDASPQVRIVAAEALAKDAGDADAVAYLADVLVDSQSPASLRLQALNSLTFIGAPARAAIAVLDRVAMDENEYLRNAGIYLRQTLDGTYDPSRVIYDLEAQRKRLGL